MPRRKQDCPKRMKWDESHGECPKQEDGRSDDGLGLCRSSGQKVALSKEDDSSSRKDDDDEDGGDSAFESCETVKKMLKNVESSDADCGGHYETLSKENPFENAKEDDEFVKEAEGEVILRETQSVSPLPASTTCLSLSTDGPRSVCLSQSPNYLENKPQVKSIIDYDKQVEDEDRSVAMDFSGLGSEEEASGDGDHSVHEQEQDSPLDFSVKKRLDSSPSITSNVATNKGSDDLNLAGMSRMNESPLDLSVPRKRGSSCSHSELRPSSHDRHRVKSSRLDNKPSSPWSAQFPFCFSPTASPNSSVEIPLWNGTVKGGRVSPGTSSSNAFQQHQSASMSYLHSDVYASSRSHKSSGGGGGTTLGSSLGLSSKSSGGTPSSSSSSNGRHNAWQSQWLSRGAEQARDVLKCVWCRKSFSSLEEMTTHMKETKHCGVQQLHHGHQMSSSSAAAHGSSSNRQGSSNSNNSGTSGSVTSKSTEEGTISSAAAAVKESMPMPRKLVRGQDVWLGKGAEQTKQILKCMWCGQSFKSLADMTTHMQQTQHYTNIISQEQIISWKSPEEKGCLHSHVNAVLTCKVCDQTFSSLKELSIHMAKNSHYKEHILRSITENGGRRRQTREKRKKSLPVRKLLELERAQNEVRVKTGSSSSPLSNVGVLVPVSSNGRITCEKCGHKIDTQSFVDHIRLCVGGGGGGGGGGGRATKCASSTSSSSPDVPVIENLSPVGLVTVSKSKFMEDGGSTRTTSSPKREKGPSTALTSSSSPPQQQHRLLSSNTSNGRLEPETPSVLNAIERLIEKSFESKRNRHVYVGPSATSPSPSRSLTSPPNKKTSRSVDRDTPSLFASHEHSKGRLTPSTKGNYVSQKDYGGEIRQKRFAKQNDEESDGDDIKTERVLIKEEFVEEPTTYNESSERSKRDSCSPSTRISSDALSTKTSRESPLGTHVMMPPPASSVSPPRIVESPGSCSDGSLGGGGGGSSSAGRLLSFVRSSSSPVSPSCSDHPLKELQKLLDKTNVSVSKTSVSTPSSVITSSALGTNGGGVTVGTSSPSTIGSLLSFSYVCADTSPLTGDSVIKCAFCDTPFISKTAYRQHLSKMHSKDLSEDSVSITTTVSSSFGLSSSLSIPSSTSITSTAVSNTDDGCITSPSSASKSTLANKSSSKAEITSTAHDESPHSKFLKYTELAKQLSSKYV